jgi:predicted RNA-binding Zn ribbon-like protein
LTPKLINSAQESSPLCLDFVNTCEWHASAHPEEKLLSYGDLLKWGEKMKLLLEERAGKLVQAAAARPGEADQVLTQAIALREAIYRILVALIQNQVPAEADLADLNSSLTKMTRGAKIIKSAQGFAWQWDVDDDALDWLLWPVTLSAAELLTSEDIHRLGQCADDRGCGWLFLDTSKNHSRRWCDINDCGNRAKQRRHYERIRKQA